jgi:FAD/FMN-containing dehydrogenase
MDQVPPMTGSDFSEAVRLLAQGVEGPVLVGADPEYDEARAGYNLAVDQTPAVIVQAVSADDVAAAVRFGAEHGRPVTAQATFHGGDAAPPDAILISTRRMDSFNIDDEAKTATLAAGVRWQAVVQAAAEFDLAPLNGASPEVGAVSYILGGGLGLLAREYGYAADHVRSLEIVTADGIRRTASPDENEDLFWAVRGGKGAFGVVTSIVIDLLPVTRLYGGGLYFAGESAPEVLQAYRAWTATVPEQLTSSAALLRLPDDPILPLPLRGRQVVHLRIAFNGAVADGEQLVAPLRQVAPLLLDTVGDMPYAAVGSIHSDPPMPIPFFDASATLTDLTAEAVDALIAAATAGANGLPTLVEIRHLGGALGRRPVHANAVGSRDAEFLVYVTSIASPPMAGHAAASNQAVLTAIRPWSTGLRLLNFTKPSSPQLYRTAFPADVYNRIRAVKTRYDPTNVFRLGGF